MLVTSEIFTLLLRSQPSAKYNLSLVRSRSFLHVLQFCYCYCPPRTTTLLFLLPIWGALWMLSKALWPFSPSQSHRWYLQKRHAATSNTFHLHTTCLLWICCHHNILARRGNMGYASPSPLHESCFPSPGLTCGQEREEVQDLFLNRAFTKWQAVC